MLNIITCGRKGFVKYKLISIFLELCLWIFIYNTSQWLRRSDIIYSDMGRKIWVPILQEIWIPVSLKSHTSGPRPARIPTICPAVSHYERNVNCILWNTPSSGLVRWKNGRMFTFWQRFDRTVPDSTEFWIYTDSAEFYILQMIHVVVYCRKCVRILGYRVRLSL